MSKYPTIWTTLEKWDRGEVAEVIARFKADPEVYTATVISGLLANAARIIGKPNYTFSQTRVKEWRRDGFPMPKWFSEDGDAVNAS